MITPMTSLRFRDKRSLWQRIRNKVPPFPARTLYVGFQFQVGQGWHQAEASVDAPDGVGVLQLTFETFEDGQPKQFDNVAVID